MKKRLKLEPNNNNLIIWEAEQPKAILQLVHGMVEYVERYEEFALAMNNEALLLSAMIISAMVILLKIQVNSESFLNLPRNSSMILK